MQGRQREGRLGNCHARRTIQELRNVLTNGSFLKKMRPTHLFGGSGSAVGRQPGLGSWAPCHWSCSDGGNGGRHDQRVRAHGECAAVEMARSPTQRPATHGKGQTVARAAARSVRIQGEEFSSHLDGCDGCDVERVNSGHMLTQIAPRLPVRCE